MKNRPCFTPPSPHMSGESHRPMTLILLKSIAIRLPSLSRYFCKSMPSCWQKVVYIPPICVTIWLPFVSRCFAEVLGSGVVGMPLSLIALYQSPLDIFHLSHPYNLLQCLPLGIDQGGHKNRVGSTCHSTFYQKGPRQKHYPHLFPLLFWISFLFLLQDAPCFSRGHSCLLVAVCALLESLLTASMHHQLLLAAISCY